MKQGLNTSNVYAYNSQAGETIPLEVTDTSDSVTFALNPSKLNYDIIVTSIGPDTAFIAFGLGSATAQVPDTTGTTGATPILPGAIYTFQKNTDNTFCDTVAAICDAGEEATLYFTSVQGS